ncbi:hypothetical protein CCACVL1_06726 [Corchorus capsularis]|uniref:Uncharacterized protein n=1 Tax=Corchorus capsularis TaxID=210143 RepID=A0A1R3JDK9_COCAP|nr:hypothetical protein CCACVL1_06726 [Corchorus capsularis]
MAVMIMVVKVELMCINPNQEIVLIMEMWVLAIYLMIMRVQGMDFLPHKRERNVIKVYKA